MVDHLEKSNESIGEVCSQGIVSEQVGKEDFKELSREEISLEFVRFKDSRSFGDEFIDNICSVGNQFISKPRFFSVKDLNQFLQFLNSHFLLKTLELLLYSLIYCKIIRSFISNILHNEQFSETFSKTGMFHMPDQPIHNIRILPNKAHNLKTSTFISKGSPYFSGSSQQ